jgi:Cytochrome c
MKLLLAAAIALTPAQERGQDIYFRGESARTITAVVGEGGTPFSASIVPCVNCHGEDGRGRAEASVRPADITPAALSRRAAVNGRTRPAYSRSHLIRAIAMGVDAGRNPLTAAMPRYQLTREDANDLLEFLAVLDRLPQPGVTDDAIRIGVRGDEVAPDLVIYGRRIELVRDGSKDVFLRVPGDVESLTLALEMLAKCGRDVTRAKCLER